MSTVRIGVLGAARIAPAALIRPARVLDGVQVAAIAARDRNRAGTFAAKHGIATVHDSYDALLADPAIDAIYNPLPNGLHGRWTIAALRAGKHVLCEKPFTANADEAESVAEVARATGPVVMEAFHYRYHGLTARMLDILASGELGDVRHLDTWLCFPLPVADIRWQLDLAGGALMDAGCYAVHLLRTLAGAEPVVRSAQAKLKSPGCRSLPARRAGLRRRPHRHYHRIHALGPAVGNRRAGDWQCRYDAGVQSHHAAGLPPPQHHHRGGQAQGARAPAALELSRATDSISRRGAARHTLSHPRR